MFSLKSIGTFILWTVTSFVCHWSAKRQIKTWGANSGILSFEAATILTLTQCFVCLIVVNFWSDSTEKENLKYVKMFKVAAHVLATLCTNFSMTYMNAASTFTIRLLEPVTSALVQGLIQKIPLPISSILSLPVLIYGALMFTGNGTIIMDLSPGIWLAFASNVILALRNAAIATEHRGEVDTKLRKKRIIFIGLNFLFLLIVLFYSAKFEYRDRVIWLSVYSMTSGVFHVVYSYISTNIVLKTMTVLNHSILNIFKRLLVILLLYVVGSRTATLTNWYGFLLCIIGLLINLYGKYGKLMQFEQHQEVASEKFQSFKGLSQVVKWCLMLSLCVIGLTTYNYNPYSSVIYNNSLPDPVRLEKQLHLKQSLNVHLYEAVPSIPFDTKTDIVFQLFHENISSPLPGSVHFDNRLDIIDYSQAYHESLFSELLKPYKYVILLDAAVHENKGDPAITIGELILLRKLKKELLFWCNFSVCTMANLEYGLSLAERHSPNNVAILLHGGGNIMGWVINDKLRAKIFKLFKGYHFFLFPQSFFLTDNKQHLLYCENLYRNQANFTMILRDLNSFMLAKKHFTGLPRLMMAPDMAFQIGPIARSIAPLYDILWIHRTDKEKTNDTAMVIPEGISVKKADWLSWPTPNSKNHMEQAYLIVNNGLVFIQRGRVLITDRLHGHILGTLVDMPHVIINNKWNKIGNYHNTWTRGLKNTRVADNSSHAMLLAVELLNEYKESLPQKVPFMDVRDKPI